MQILHFSDVHIGVESYGRTDPITGLSTRLLDFLQTLDECVDYAINNQVDLVVFAGDAYKSREPSQTHQREFAKRIAKLSSAGVPVFLLTGNHDMPHIAGKATALEIFRTLEVPNVVIGDSLKTYAVETKSGSVQIVALPWIRRSQFLVRDDIRKRSPQEITKAIEDNLTELIKIEAQALDHNLPALFVGHVSVGDARTGSEQYMMLGTDHHLLLSAVTLPQFDYIALGHIHRHQVLNENPLVVYSGSLERVDFGEEHDQKGFCIVELDLTQPLGNRQLNFDFVPVKARRFVTISVELAIDDLFPMKVVLQSINSAEIEDAVVKILITVPRSMEGHINDAEILTALEKAHYVVAVSKEIKEETRTRLGEVNLKVLSPQAALKKYLESRDVPKDRIENLVDRAAHLMQETDSE